MESHQHDDNVFALDQGRTCNLALWPTGSAYALASMLARERERQNKDIDFGELGFDCC